VPGLRIIAEGRVAVVTVNRPEVLNALNTALLEELLATLQDLGSDPGVGVIIVTGAGERSFIAGADIKEMDGKTPLEARAYSELGQEIAHKLETMRKPTIAAVNGYALGGGCELAMLCDIIVAGENARFGQPEINIGLIPGAGGTQRLTRSVGKYVATEMILTGRMLGAEEAFQRGLVARVVPHELIVEEAVRLARDLARRAPISLRLAKEAITRGFEGRVDDGIDFERKAFYLLFATQDAHEGMHAFIDKRQPRYEGH